MCIEIDRKTGTPHPFDPPASRSSDSDAPDPLYSLRPPNRVLESRNVEFRLCVSLNSMGARKKNKHRRLQEVQLNEGYATWCLTPIN